MLRTVRQRLAHVRLEVDRLQSDGDVLCTVLDPSDVEAHRGALHLAARLNSLARAARDVQDVLDRLTESGSVHEESHASS